MPVTPEIQKSSVELKKKLKDFTNLNNDVTLNEESAAFVSSVKSMSAHNSKINKKLEKIEKAVERLVSLRTVVRTLDKARVEMAKSASKDLNDYIKKMIQTTYDEYINPQIEKMLKIILDDIHETTKRVDDILGLI